MNTHAAPKSPKFSEHRRAMVLGFIQSSPTHVTFDEVSEFIHFSDLTSSKGQTHVHDTIGKLAADPDNKLLIVNGRILYYGDQ